MAKRVLRYSEEEFVTLLENIVKKVKAEEQRIQESRGKQRTVNGSVPSRPSNRIVNENRRPSNDRFRKL